MINSACWPLRFAIGVVYVAAILASRKLAELLEPPQRPGRLVEKPDELGFWWVED